MTEAHVMLDIETLGTRPGSMITAIGACTFGPGVARAARRTLYLRPMLEDQARVGLGIDPASVLWWLGQDDAARAAMRQRDSMPLLSALLRLRSFLLDAATGDRKLHVWCYGPSFDAVMIERAWYRLHCGGAPWSYRELRCLRTLLGLAGLSMRDFPPAVAHDALADAMAQADAAEVALRILAARVFGEAQEEETAHAPA